MEFGKPDAGKPPVRFDEGWEAEGHWPRAFQSSTSRLLYLWKRLDLACLRRCGEVRYDRVVSFFFYVETSIPSFDFGTRERMRFQAMREWWDAAISSDTLVTFEAVFAELARAPEPKRMGATAFLKSLPVLGGGVDVNTMVDAYLTHKLMPRNAPGDARYLTLATFHRCSIFATWNCQHLANANKLAHIRNVNASMGMETPLLVTPFELLGRAA